MNTKVDTFFDAMNHYYALREEMCYLVSQVTGLVLIDDMWHQISFDLTDKSFELNNVALNTKLTIDQCSKLLSLGFQEWWLNFVDGVEDHYHREDNQFVCTTKTGRQDESNNVKTGEGVN